jgi:hypothetical protein
LTDNITPTSLPPLFPLYPRFSSPLFHQEELIFVGECVVYRKGITRVEKNSPPPSSPPPPPLPPPPLLPPSPLCGVPRGEGLFEEASQGDSLYVFLPREQMERRVGGNGRVKVVDGEREEKGGQKEGGNEEMVETLLWVHFFFFLFFFFYNAIIHKFPLPFLPFLFLSSFSLSLPRCILSPLTFFVIFFSSFPHHCSAFFFFFLFIFILSSLPSFTSSKTVA